MEKKRLGEGAGVSGPGIEKKITRKTDTGMKDN